ncbi:MAG: fibrillarin-like rRNA/tRNA 2'-O-methyltransferase [Candidatus Marsarchaeota archaeon]|nr:fibrillarin-like rRNA/tRNA 2'-O-methyltransferase [Candidatus Marsarchaeota archaeon]
MEAKELFPNVYKIDGRLATKNLVKGNRVYGEQVFNLNGAEYRSWTPYRSKLSAAIMNGLKTFEFDNGSSVLYLGAANGTTPSHVSDIVGKTGKVYSVEMSKRSMRDLLEVCEERANMLPILSDARDIDSYSDIVGKCDIIYQDVSAREQAEILKKNGALLKKNGYAYFVIKSQSIDVSKEPKLVYKEVLESLEDAFDIVEKLSLEPYDTAHMFAVLRKK